MEKISLSTKIWDTLNFPPPILPTFSALNIHHYNLLPKKRSYKDHIHLIPEEEAYPSKKMASTSAVSMATPLTRSIQNRQPSADAFLKPLPLRTSKTVKVSKQVRKFEVNASLKEKAVTGLTAAALTASMIVPDVAEASVSPSLKNFLFSIVAGGVVLFAIVGAVVGVANFDPVERS